jgi:hypothetical protein
MRGKKRLLIAGLILAALAVGFPAALHSEDLTVIEGQVQYITGDVIKVGGDFFYITDVPIEDASGNDLSAYEIKVGRKVAVFVSGGKVKSVLAYDEFMVE